MGIITARMNSMKDQQRLLNKISKLVDQAWKEANEVSGNDPKYNRRIIVWQGLKDIQLKLTESEWAGKKF